MIELAVLRDEVVDGQRRAAGRKIRQKVVVSVDRYNVMVSEITGTAPPHSLNFANFAQLAKHLSKPIDGDDPFSEAEINRATVELREVLGKLYGCDLSGKSIVQMNSDLKLGHRPVGKGGTLDIFLRLKGTDKAAAEDGEEDNEEVE